MEYGLYRTEQLRTRLIGTARLRINDQYQNINRELQGTLRRVPNDAVLNIGSYRQVEAEARRRYAELAREIQRDLTVDMTNISEQGFREFSNHLISYGMPNRPYFVNVPKSVVQNILNGTVYRQPDNLGTSEHNWGLSKAIWGDNRKTMEDIHQIIATGVASGSSAMQISEDLERYMNPTTDKSKLFDWDKVYPGVKKLISYNASRLVRTLLNHAYQQSFKEAGDRNPWIRFYIWHSAGIHGRTCQVCIDLDGQRFRKDSDSESISPYPPLPLDHPNGLCSWSYDFDTRSMTTDLANWTNGTGNPQRNREIDDYQNYILER